MLDQALGERLAAIALGHVEQEYPNHIMHVLRGPEDAAGPRALHPIFFGSYDWHSCVHSYWLLAQLLARVPDLACAADIRALFARRITADAVAREIAYFKAEDRGPYERPYGWAWLLKLAAELAASPDSAARAAGDTLAPFGVFIAECFEHYWPRQAYPIRAGAHGNSAFATVMALDYARQNDRQALIGVLKERAHSWFDDDRDSPAWEPGGDAFLSPTLIEALCMQRVLPAARFDAWLGSFLPRLAKGQPHTLFEPAAVTDRTDGKIAHLDGLNLSRAWCWRELATGFPDDDPRRAVATRAAERHLSAALPHLETHYMGSHWLASFALLALGPAEPSG